MCAIIFNMFEQDMHYRHEHKYLEPEVRLKAAELRLASFVKKDSHVSDKGFYSIRSLYFDDYYDTFINENLDGTDNREKWRIRIYDRSSDFISLERKSRKADLISKASCRIDAGILDNILHGRMDIRSDNPALLNVFYTGMRTRMIRPAVIVEYERTPFIAKEGNTRITFDRNIRSSPELDALLADRELSARPVLSAGCNLLEVKFDAFLPDHLAHALETGRMQRQTFSKYYLARRFTYNGLTIKNFNIK